MPAEQLGWGITSSHMNLPGRELINNSSYAVNITESEESKEDFSSMTRPHQRRVGYDEHQISQNPPNQNSPPSKDERAAITKKSSKFQLALDDEDSVPNRRKKDIIDKNSK